MDGIVVRDGLQQLDAPSLRDQAKRAVRGRIVAGDLVPGELYSVAFFSERLGVSATPIREALLDLASDGLLEVVRNRGFRVVQLTDHDLDEILDLRLLLEVPTLGRIADRLTPEQLAEVGDLAAAIEPSARDGDVAGFIEADRRFHLELLTYAGNRRLVELIGKLRDQMRMPQLAEAGHLQSSMAEHHEILDALRRGDRPGVESVMRRHLEHTRGIWAGRAEPDRREPL